MRLPQRRRRPDVAVEVGPGERLLAAAETDAGVAGGTREALYLPGVRLPWEEVEAAAWDEETATLEVREVGRWGQARGVHRVVVAEPGLLLQLVRERVTASVVLQRHVAVTERSGLRVVARRSASGDRALAWFVDYDEGLDPDDPAVRRVAEEALAAARADVGEA